MRRILVMLGLACLGLLVVWLGLSYLGLWPSSTPQPRLRATLGEDDPADVSCLAFSPDGKLLASGSSSNAKIKLWDVTTGKNLTTLKGHEGIVNSVAFSPGGKTLAAGVSAKGGDTAIMLWDVTTRGQRVTFKGKAVRSVAFSPDGKLLASASRDETIKLWDVATGNNTMTAKAWGTLSVVFSPDGKLLASASMDGTVKLWDLASGKEEPDFKWTIGPWGEATCVAFSPDGRDLAAGGATDMVSFGRGGGSLMLWDLTSRKEKASFWAARHCENVDAIAFSPDGKLLATGSQDGKVQLWDTSRGKLISTLWTHFAYEVQAVAFSPDGKILAAGRSNGQIRLWDMQDAK